LYELISPLCSMPTAWSGYVGGAADEAALTRSINSSKLVDDVDQLLRAISGEDGRQSQSMAKASDSGVHACSIISTRVRPQAVIREEAIEPRSRAFVALVGIVMTSERDHSAGVG
jgi:hypothetical protein